MLKNDPDLMQFITNLHGCYFNFSSLDKLVESIFKMYISLWKNKKLTPVLQKETTYSLLQSLFSP